MNPKMGSSLPQWTLETGGVVFKRKYSIEIPHSKNRAILSVKVDVDNILFVDVNMVSTFVVDKGGVYREEEWPSNPPSLPRFYPCWNADQALSFWIEGIAPQEVGFLLTGVPDESIRQTLQPLIKQFNSVQQISTPGLVDKKTEPFAAEVMVSTASGIITLAGNPYMALVADSAKHGKPVIPGGKLEQGESARVCLQRELVEEIGAEPKNLRYIGTAKDPNRDVRFVAPSKLATAVTEPALPENLPVHAKIKAHYGCPDFIYVGEVKQDQIAASEELKNLRFIDVRNVEAEDLGAGHDVFLFWYREILEWRETSFPPEALLNIERERRVVARGGKLIS